MSENIIFLLIGSGIGLVTSLVTTWFQHQLQKNLEREKRQLEAREKMIEGARDLLQSSKHHSLRYGSVGPVELCRLTVGSGPDQGTILSIRKYVVIIGSSTELSDVVLANSNFEETHLRVIVVNDIFVLEDISGRLDTRVNDTPLIKPALLKDGDQIKVGEILLSFISTE